MDVIDRQSAIEKLRVAYFDNDIQNAKDDPCIVDAITDWAIRQIKSLPSVEPDWNEMLVICDNCGHAIRVKRIVEEDERC